MATKRKGGKRKGTKKAGRKKGAAGGLTARVRSLETFRDKQRKWNRGVEKGINHIYSATKTTKPAALKRLPKV